MGGKDTSPADFTQYSWLIAVTETATPTPKNSQDSLHERGESDPDGDLRPAA